MFSPQGTSRDALFLLVVPALVVHLLAPRPAADEPVDYLRAIKPMLAEKCFSCNGGLKQKADLRVDTVKGMREGGGHGPVIVPDHSDKSLLVDRAFGLYFDTTSSRWNMRKPSLSAPARTASAPERTKPARAAVNRQITLAARPIGFPKESDFRLVETAIPAPGDGQFLVRSLYLSLDPYMRGRMSDRPSYAAPVKVGAVMVGGVVGEVIQSHHPKFPEGAIVVGILGWQEFAVSDGQGVRIVDPASAPVSTALGVLGMPGLTAYFGLLDICKPQPGETVVVSAAAGAVGSAVGQIAKIKGCRVVGVAGSDEKIDYVTHELGFEAAFNYKTVGNCLQKLKELCPAGIDVYFDNVGGFLADAVFLTMSVGARIAVCGQISEYNLDQPEMGPRLLWNLIVKRAKVQGFLVSDFAARYKEAMRQLADWVRDGRLKYRETLAQGIENAPKAFIGMLNGQNIGKQLVQVLHLSQQG